MTASFGNTVASRVIALSGAWQVEHSLTFNTRLRLAYGITNATEEFTREQFLRRSPAKSGTATTYAHLRQDGTFGYEQTSITSAHIMAGFAYRFSSPEARAAVRKVPAKKATIDEERQITDVGKQG